MRCCSCSGCLHHITFGEHSHIRSTISLATQSWNSDIQNGRFDDASLLSTRPRLDWLCDAGRDWKMPPVLQTYYLLQEGSVRAGYPSEVLRCCTTAISTELLATGRKLKYQRAAAAAPYE
eukprot:9343423-Pyramimonas_sp.AAC.1